MTLTPTEDQYTEDQCFITTVSGRRFYLDKPEFYLPDIAHGLGMLCRFNGQATDFISVAEHSITVAQLMAEWGADDPLEGLLHDVTEAYLSDMPAPYKQKFRELSKFDKELDYKARLVFNIAPVQTAECKKADWVALFVEAYWLTYHKGEEFADPENLRDFSLQYKDKYRPMNLPHRVAKEAFLAEYVNLAGSRSKLL